MIVGYARVSTVDQKLKFQLDALSTAGCERVFRAMASWRLGSPLCGSEVVHHVNGDLRDHPAGNLAVVSSQRGHMLLHHYL